MVELHCDADGYMLYDPTCITTCICNLPKLSTTDTSDALNKLHVCPYIKKCPVADIVVMCELLGNKLYKKGRYHVLSIGR